MLLRQSAQPRRKQQPGMFAQHGDEHFVSPFLRGRSGKGKIQGQQHRGLTRSLAQGGYGALAALKGETEERSFYLEIIVEFETQNVRIFMMCRQKRKRGLRSIVQNPLLFQLFHSDSNGD